MAEHNIPSPLERPDHQVSANASFRTVVRHTDWYLRRNDDSPHYRYRRYQEVISARAVDQRNRRQVHVDIGCGAGLFSWVFLDWARNNNLSYDHIDLYGLDHCPEMIRLAHQMRAGLMSNIANYPELHYTHDVEVLLQRLTGHHHQVTDYKVTFGHVLVQSPYAIPEFARIVAHIMALLDAQSSCVVMAVDALSAQVQFAQSWNTLLENLGQFGILHNQVTVQRTSINDARRARIARLVGA